ncbi:MAG TPA: formylglycine-generating enzyme family protein [Planctomycetaceae bacterium]|jgi:formylglycine-generating enzyme required for sulfatase activity|nr:formylglycine-generating enzyme family protein [Planctomycetaceae bacterium]
MRIVTDLEHVGRRLPEGWKYILPAEAQWEYACRAGTQSRFSFGNDRSLLKEYGWFRGNTGFDKMHPHSVGQRKPNPWGFYDMHGNVEEWCQDFYVRPNDGGEKHYRIFRGGDFTLSDVHCRSAARFYDKPEYGYWYLGFRVAAVPK